LTNPVSGLALAETVAQASLRDNLGSSGSLSLGSSFSFSFELGTLLSDSVGEGIEFSAGIINDPGLSADGNKGGRVNNGLRPEFGDLVSLGLSSELCLNVGVSISDSISLGLKSDRGLIDGLGLDVSLKVSGRLQDRAELGPCHELGIMLSLSSSLQIGLGASIDISARSCLSGSDSVLLSLGTIDDFS